MAGRGLPSARQRTTEVAPHSVLELGMFHRTLPLFPSQFLHRCIENDAMIPMRYKALKIPRERRTFERRCSLASSEPIIVPTAITGWGFLHRDPVSPLIF